MSHDLRDFRGKITNETDAVLEALNRASGRDRSEIAREVLHKLDAIEMACACHGKLRCPSLDTLARLRCPDPCILCERERSLARILFAVLCTAISLAIVVVSA